MTVKKVIAECLVKMGGKDFTNNSEYTADEQELLDALLAALNIVYREIVSEYLPLTECEEVEFEDGVLKISKLSKRILYPVRVTRGDEVKAFKAYPDRIAVNFSGKAMLEYAYMPNNEFEISDSISDLRLTESALSDGTLGEYYFANKVFDLAKSFDTSFRDKLGLLRYTGKRLRVKERRWQP